MYVYSIDGKIHKMHYGLQIKLTSVWTWTNTTAHAHTATMGIIDVVIDYFLLSLWPWVADKTALYLRYNSKVCVLRINNVYSLHHIAVAVRTNAFSSYLLLKDDSHTESHECSRARMHTHNASKIQNAPCNSNDCNKNQWCTCNLCDFMFALCIKAILLADCVHKAGGRSLSILHISFPPCCQ